MDAKKIDAVLATEKSGASAEELEKANHTASVWAGRAKTLSDENQKLKEENERLRALQGTTTVEKTLEAIPEDMKGGTPDEYLRPALTGAQKLISEQGEKTSSEIAQLKASIAERDHRDFLSRIGMRNGKFLETVQPGGANETLWAQFKDRNKETFNAIVASNDDSRFGELVNQFCATVGIPRPSNGDNATATLSPSTIPGSTHLSGVTGDSDNLTSEQYLKELERAEEMRRRGDMNGFRELDAKLRRALNEGRVK